jgi:hypothetical protein
VQLLNSRAQIIIVDGCGGSVQSCRLTVFSAFVIFISCHFAYSSIPRTLPSNVSSIMKNILARAISIHIIIIIHNQ